MAEPLKNLYDETLIENLCQEIKSRYRAFDSQSFTHHVFDEGWPDRELKQRMRHIAVCLNAHLPTNYRQAIKILKPVAKNFNGFEYMFFQDYVECYGLDDHTTSIDALEHFTRYASSEFAIRAFILQDQQRTMTQMFDWAHSKNHHVRRLASEGCRPRLPWAIALPAFMKDPRPVLDILEVLMDDDSEYVRRSVANNLNDISKDNPAVVIDYAKRYLGKSNNTDRLIKHACRTLLKQGNQETMALFGYAPAEHLRLRRFECNDAVKPGEKLDFSFTLSSKKGHIGKCRLEFAIDFKRANGSASRKVFKIAEADYAEAEKRVEKYFSFKNITTRRYYPGEHRLSIVINGEDVASKTFSLLAENQH